MCRLYHNSKKHQKDIQKHVIVYNLANMVYSLDTRAITAFKHVLSIDEACYPERLKFFFVINAPWFVYVPFARKVYIML
jgi:hypothetical protein